MVALYVLDDRLLAAAGPFRRRQLLADVGALDATLRARGGGLLVRRGRPEEVVPAEAARLSAARAYWNADVTPYAVGRDAAVARALSVGTTTFSGQLVLPPGSVLTREGRLARVFTAFHRTWQATPWDPWPEPGDAEVVGSGGDPLPPPDGQPPFPPGEAGAREQLRRFAGGPVDTYRADRDVLDGAGGSALSAALRFGTLSPRAVVRAVEGAGADREAFVRQLAWRDWFAHLLAEEPTLPTRSLRPEFEGIRWHHDPDGLEAWKSGRTGYPVVDAGMRQLAATGTMHNRARMITASFLVKDLLVDWRLGERHFRHLLVDGDVPQNAGNWQWVAGTGPDAAPYFRVFNPVTQSRAHDPTGAYIRRWVPELAGLDDDAVHAPWTVGPLELALAGVTLGDQYPAPIVDHAAARVRAIDAYRAARG